MATSKYLLYLENKKQKTKPINVEGHMVSHSILMSITETAPVMQ